jgi:hypothetical protein
MSAVTLNTIVVPTALSDLVHIGVDNISSTLLGDVDFVSNQDDGKSFISSTGVVYTLTEDVAGSAQIKADGTSSTAYEWPQSSLYHMPYTGDIFPGGPTIGYRDPATGDFTGVLSTVYWDGADPGTDTKVAYSQDSDGDYAPATDALYMDGSTTLSMINADSQDFATTFIDGAYVFVDNDADLDGFINFTKAASSGLQSWVINIDGTISYTARDNANTLRVAINGTQNIKGGWHKIHIETFENGANYDFKLFVDDIQDGPTQSNVDLSAGFVFDTFSWRGTGAAPFEGFIKEVFSFRKASGVSLRTPINGYYNFTRRLEDTATDSKRFYNQMLDIFYPNSTRYIEVSKTTGIYPSVTESLPDGYVRKEETY